MSEDFDLFPLAVAVQDNHSVTVELRHPNLPPPKDFMPIWGKECLVTDPPPAHCFKIPPINYCKLSPNLCGFPDNDTTALAEIMTLPNSSGGLGKVVPGTDLGGFPPSLIPLIKVIGDALKQAEIDISADGIEGLTMKIHKIQ